MTTGRGGHSGSCVFIVRDCSIECTLGGKRSFAVPANQNGQPEKTDARSRAPVIFGLQVRQTATSSPDWLMLRSARRSAVTKVSKTFNNHLGFEWGLCQLQSGRFGPVPKRRGFGSSPEGRGSCEQFQPYSANAYFANQNRCLPNERDILDLPLEAA